MYESLPIGEGRDDEEANIFMMKKLVSVLIVLCLLMSSVSGALAAYDGSKPECRNPEHEKWDGQDHNRPQSCWVKGHYNCDGMNHERAACGTWGHFYCDGRDHSLNACGAEGHYSCDKKAHAAASCGIANHCVLDGKRHVQAECGTAGHYACDGMKHSRPACGIAGHVACEGDHNAAVCGVGGHFGCDGKEHTTPVCGTARHCVSDNRNHEPAACGNPAHFACDGKKHEPAACGNPAHFTCDGMKHGASACKVPGHFVCDGFEHKRASCGVSTHYACDGLEHVKPECHRYGHCVNDGKDHGPAACGHAGHYACDGRTHELASCGVEGHYICEGRKHQNKPVSKYCNAVPQHMVCQGDQMHYCDPAQGGCGDEYWCSRSNAHTPCRMCGLLWCDRSLGGHETPCGNANHRPCVYAMNGKKYVKADHQWCKYCGKGICNGEEHGNTKCCDPCPQCGGPEKLGKEHWDDCGKHLWCTNGGSHFLCEYCGIANCDSKYNDYNHDENGCKRK